MKRLVLAVAALAIVAGLVPSTAYATPAFARQTGVSCQACHTVFPELTPFGRKFKLSGYTFTNIKQLQAVSERGTLTLSLADLPPVSVQLQASNTELKRAIPDTGLAKELAQENTTQFPQALSIFYTGKIADQLGAFLQLTWEPSSDSVGIDNSDLRFANHTTAFESHGVPDFIYGLTLNNNPTSQDVWNSTPAWGYPYILSNVLVPPIASALLDGQLAQEAAGFGGYLYLFDHLYIEGSGYRSAQTSFTNNTTGGPGPLDSTSPNVRISGPAAPYWRVAWEQAWGDHSLEFGTYGIWARTHPPGVGESGPTNTFTDVALDGQYQFITDDHIFTMAGTWIHEERTFNNLTLAAHKHTHLDTARLTASYYFRRWIGGSVQGFSTTGTRDPVQYPDGAPAVGSANGRPDTQGAILELDFLPWLNTKLGAQYTIYSKFNGRSHNYDGAGRNASDNNTLFVYIWTAF
jgi:hypothetical protein